MAEETKNPNTGALPVAQPEPQNPLASVDNGGSIPLAQPFDIEISREAANIARELRTLAHRVEGFKVRTRF